MSTKHFLPKQNSTLFLDTVDNVSHSRRKGGEGEKRKKNQLFFRTILCILVFIHAREVGKVTAQAICKPPSGLAQLMVSTCGSFPPPPQTYPPIRVGSVLPPFEPTKAAGRRHVQAGNARRRSIAAFGNRSRWPRRTERPAPRPTQGSPWSTGWDIVGLHAQRISLRRPLRTMVTKLVLDDGTRVRNERPDYICAERDLAGRRSSRKGCLNTLLQPHGEIQIGPRPIAIFQHGHPEDQLVNILKVFVAPALHRSISWDTLDRLRNVPPCNSNTTQR